MMNNLILEKIKDNAVQNPDRIAFVVEDSCTTWGEVFERVNTFSADQVKSKSINGFCWIEAERNINTLITILVCICHSIDYVLVDPQISESRSAEYRKQLEITGVKKQNTKAALPRYGIFTSGSTGTPKLVIKEVESVWRFIGEYCNKFGFDESDVFGNQVPFFFDAFCKDFFATIYLGAKLIVISKYYFASPIKLIEYLNSCQISVVQWVPSAFKICEDMDVFSVLKPEYLRCVLYVGERVRSSTVNYWKKGLSKCSFVNLYGASEVVGSSCYYIIDREFAEDETIPVGKPFDGFEISLALEKGPTNANNGHRSCYALEKSKVGEIVVSTNGEMLDNESVMLNKADNCRLIAYYTGDYGEFDSDGNLIILGRKDDLIKFNGYRINLQEIEKNIVAIEGVEDSIVAFDEIHQCIVARVVKRRINSDADNKKSACVEINVKNTEIKNDIRKDWGQKEEEAIFIQQIRKELAQVLPKYMIPKRIDIVGQLPYLSNGKKDRKIPSI